MNRLFSFLLLVFSFVSCTDEPSSELNQSGITEGIIQYDLKYPYLDSNDLGLNILPKVMELTFKDNKYKIESVGGMGLFVGGYVSNNETKEMDQFLKIISAKFVSRFNEKGVKTLHKNYPSYQLKALDSTRVIAGYKCKGYQVVFYSNVVDDHILWYTTEINLPGLSWCTPFPKVNGVLMDYQMQRNGLVINFVANNVVSDTINPDVFKIPLKYKVVSNRVLARKMEEAFGGFEY